MNQASPDRARAGLFGRSAVTADKPFAVLPELVESSPAESPPAGPDDKPPRRVHHPALVLAVLATATFLTALDLFVVNVALNPIGRGLHESSLSNLSWILNGYAIVYAALLVPAGRLADRIGRKTGFLAGVALFTAASVGAALSGDLWVLVAFRFLQAAGAAALTPASLGLVLAIAPRGKTAAYVQIWSAAGALAAASGPTIGGLLVQASWRWIFLINVPVGIAAIIAGARMLPSLRHDTETRIPDLLGGLLLIISIGSLALGLVKAPDWGWGAEGTIACLAVAAAGLAAFAYRSARSAVPIVDLRLFRNPVFTAANVSALLFYASFTAFLLGPILWLQDRWDWSAIKVGLGVAPGPLMVFITAVIAQELLKKVPVGRVAAAGGVLAAIGMSAIAISTRAPHLTYAAQILPGFLIGGIGIGLALPSIISSATRDLLPHQAATGSAVLTMACQIGSVIGVSLLVIFESSTAHRNDPHYNFALALGVASALMIISAIAALGLGIRRPADTTAIS